MTDTLIFVPVSSEQALVLLQERQLRDLRAFSVTAELLEMLEYGQDRLEDAEFATMTIASVAGLARFGERLVLVAEIPSDTSVAVIDPPNGEIEIDALAIGQVVAYFAEQDGVDFAPAAAAANGQSVDDAWEQPEVMALLETADL